MRLIVPAMLAVAALLFSFGSPEVWSGPALLDPMGTDEFGRDLLATAIAATGSVGAVTAGLAATFSAGGVTVGAVTPGLAATLSAGGGVGVGAEDLAIATRPAVFQFLRSGVGVGATGADYSTVAEPIGMPLRAQTRN